MAGDCKGTKVPNSAESCSQIKDVPCLRFESEAMWFVEKQWTVGNQPLETLLESVLLVQCIALWDHTPDITSITSTGHNQSRHSHWASRPDFGKVRKTQKGCIWLYGLRSWLWSTGRDHPSMNSNLPKSKSCCYAGVLGWDAVLKRVLMKLDPDQTRQGSFFRGVISRVKSEWDFKLLCSSHSLISWVGCY